MPIQLFLSGTIWCLGFPLDASSPPVCVDTSSSDVTVSIPDPSPSSPPIQVSIGGADNQVSIPGISPFEITSGNEVTVEFPSAGSIVVPRPSTGTGGPGIRVKNGRLVGLRPSTAVRLKDN